MARCRRPADSRKARAQGRRLGRYSLSQPDLVGVRTAACATIKRLSFRCFARADAQQGVLFRSVIERTARVLATTGKADDLALAGRLLSAATTSESARAVVTGLDLGLAGRTLEETPPPLAEALNRLWTASAASPEAALDARMRPDAPARGHRNYAATGRRREAPR